MVKSKIINNSQFTSYFTFVPYYFTAQSYLLCYQCVSTHPGCGTPFKWMWYKSISCPEEDDICVKVIEKVGGNYYYGGYNIHHCDNGL